MVSRKNASSTSEVSLYVWGSGGYPVVHNKAIDNWSGNTKAIFCTASYYSQPVLANVTMPSRNITHVERTGNRTSLTGATGFARTLNGSFFDGIGVGAEFLDSKGNVVGLDFKPSAIPNTNSQLRRSVCPPGDRETTASGHVSWVHESQCCIFYEKSDDIARVCDV